MRGFLSAAIAIAIAQPTTTSLNVPFAFAFSPRPDFSSNRTPNPQRARRASSSSDADISPRSPPDVLCLGETLWDSLPAGMYLGGAPANVAAHFAALVREGESNGVAVATCLGNDLLGREARRRLECMGVRTEYAQIHGEWETGMAIATIDRNGDASYQFNTPAAWDGLDMNEQLYNLLHAHKIDANTTRIFIMGTIAARLQSQHGATSASTLTAVRNKAPEGSVVLDVNLRSPWYDPQRVLELARGGDSSSKDRKKLALLKLNEEELVLIEDWCGFESTHDHGNGLTGSILKNRMKRLAAELHSLRICVTRGEHGAAIWCDGTAESDDVFHEHTGYPIETTKDADTVGAGDAFLAALVHSLFILEEDPDEALARACALGGYVAGCRGATPSHGDAPLELRRIFQREKIG
ncbi:hypothetical protein ACHAWX_006620 [Stephanocyclus meneghinianus]